MALEKRPLMDVEVPIGDADGEVAERVGCDVDAARRKTVALHRREGSIVPNDLGDRIRRRYVAPPPPSYEVHGPLTLQARGSGRKAAQEDTPEHWPRQELTLPLASVAGHVGRPQDAYVNSCVADCGLVTSVSRETGRG